MKTHRPHDEAADGPYAARIVEQIRREVAARIRDGQYADPTVVWAERHGLAELARSDELLDLYFGCLRGAVQVDIDYFEIVDRRAGLRGWARRSLKCATWKLLKFYTDRMWTQQNRINTLMMAAIESATAGRRQADRDRE